MVDGRPGGGERIVVLGAGPTGLGAAHRLAELGHADWDVYERSSRVGGLASSVRDPQGFIWDHGGHVMFSHFAYVDALVADLLGRDCEVHERQASVRIDDRNVPYPLQHNIHRLPEDVFAACVAGIEAAQHEPGPSSPSYEQWLLATFGTGVEHFFRPYNEKVWAHPLDEMSADWQGERVPEVDLDRIAANAAADRDDAGWGPNQTFTFPAEGTGMLYDRMAQRFDRPVHLGAAARSIDPTARTVTFDHGTTRYDRLISTLPITELIGLVGGCPPAVARAAAELRHTSGLFVGIGVRGEVPPERCWIYFPDPEVPFYRVTYLSNYSAAMVPSPGHFSLLAEISVSRHRPFDASGAIEATVRGLVRSGVLTEGQATDDVVSRHLLTARHSYPVPTLGRDAALHTIQSYLAGLGIASRGRFGAWRYEIGNTDHSIMQGVEAVDAIRTGSPETTFAS